jgi:hypothetical protein
MSARVTSNDECSLHARYNSHAHGLLQKIWTSYAVQPGICNLSSVNLQFWRWKHRSLHPSIADVAADMVRSKTILESTRHNHQLVIKARDERKVTTTYFNEIREMFVNHCIKVSYVATHQDQRERHRG